MAHEPHAVAPVAPACFGLFPFVIFVFSCHVPLLLFAVPCATRPPVRVGGCPLNLSCMSVLPDSRWSGLPSTCGCGNMSLCFRPGCIHWLGLPLACFFQSCSLGCAFQLLAGYYIVLWPLLCKYLRLHALPTLYLLDGVNYSAFSCLFPRWFRMQWTAILFLLGTRYCS